MIFKAVKINSLYMELIDGKKIASDIKSELATKVKTLLDHGLSVPHLAVVIVGEDGASKTYVESIEKTCKEVGYISSVYQFSSSISEEELIKVIDFLNDDNEIDGYIIQLPLPKQISADRIIASVDPKKDMDGMHPVNCGNLMLGKECFVPATPHGTVELLKRQNIDFEGKHCVIIGRSNIVGKPLALLLADKENNATVTVCHSRTQNLKEICAQADILLVAIGKPEMITAEYVKKDAVVVDIGMHRMQDSSTEKGYRLCGDVKFEEVAKKCSFITPVPGGVGPMTMVSLLLNVMAAYQRKNEANLKKIM